MSYDKAPSLRIALPVLGLNLNLKQRRNRFAVCLATLIVVGCVDQNNVNSTKRTRLVMPTAPKSTKKQDAGFHPQIVARPFPIIKSAPILSASEADSSLENNSLVLGVSINQHARAYPIPMLCGPTREIINDLVGDTAIAATW